MLRVSVAGLQSVVNNIMYTRRGTCMCSARYDERDFVSLSLVQSS